MRIGLAQINCQIGAFDQNASKILQFANAAKDRHCDLVVFPELALYGYWPCDLLEQKYLVDKQLKKLEEVSLRAPKGIALLVGAVTYNKNKTGKRLHNSLALIIRGKSPVFFHKELLPNYDVFDETRHFSPGKMTNNILKLKGKTILITICEDIWAGNESWIGTRYPENPIEKLKNKKIDLVINSSASPFSIGKNLRRKATVTKIAKTLKAPVIFTNLVGCQDELIFDGGSFAINKNGEELARSVYFQEDLNILDLGKNVGGTREVEGANVDLLKGALVLGIKDFCKKINIDRVHLGLSGGVDSALVACLAVDALGPQKVTCFALPGPYSSNISLDYAKTLAKNLGCDFKTISINSAYDTIIKNLENSLGNLEFGLLHENLQSRLRALFLSAYSNAKKSLLLATGNKDEFAVGYTTLYGDMCGGLAPIGDLLKNQVYELCELYNEQGELIPQKIIDRAPTAELRPNQKDTDSLPEYNKLDPLVHRFVVNADKPKSKAEEEIYSKILAAEFKRWQAPPILRVTDRAFGSGRRYPITNQKYQ